MSKDPITVMHWMFDVGRSSSVQWKNSVVRRRSRQETVHQLGMLSRRLVMI